MKTGAAHSGVVGVAAATVALAAYGCKRDVRLDDHKVPSVTVGAVSHYGERLDRSATPERVAYVALRAIRADFAAGTEAERERVLRVQFDVCAANELQRINRTSLSRDEWVYNVVYRWTPTVSHYVADFPTTWSAAKERLQRRTIERIPDHPTGARRCELALEVADPSGGPNAQVVLLTWLVEDDGYWRVTHFGFDRLRRSLGPRQASATP